MTTPLRALPAKWRDTLRSNERDMRAMAECPHASSPEAKASKMENWADRIAAICALSALPAEPAAGGEAPVAWLWLKDGQPCNAFVYEPGQDDPEHWRAKGYTSAPLYAAPPAPRVDEALRALDAACALIGDAQGDYHLWDKDYAHEVLGHLYEGRAALSPAPGGEGQ